MGVEPSKLGDKMQVFGVWRYRCYSFFAAFSPFFFFKGHVTCAKSSLAGDEKYESKNHQLRREETESETSRVPQMPLSKSKKRWSPSHSIRRGFAALLLLGMRISYVKAVAFLIPTFFVYQKFWRRRQFEDLQ
jgi:hypothetical protein